MAPLLSPFGSALVGAVGGVVSGAAVYPLDTIKTRIQTEVSGAKSAGTSAAGAKRLTLNVGTRRMFVRILKEQGLAGFYRGFGASMLNTFAMQFAYFYWYTVVRRTYVTKIAKSAAALNTITELSLGALSAALAQVFTVPVSVIATRQQTSSVSQSFAATVREVLHEDGITGLWRGLKPSFVLCINPAITYGMFERLKAVILKPGEKMTPVKAFVIGALSKTLATVVTYPYIMAKTRLQAKYDPVVEPEPINDTISADPSSITVAPVRAVKKDRYAGALDCLAQVYKEKGIVGWYQGMQAQITKAVLSQALLFGIKDALEAYTILALIYYAKARGASVGLKQA